jgi:hypothetical protein
VLSLSEIRPFVAQAAAMPPDEFRAAEVVGRAVYHSLAAVPPNAFPLFLTARQYLEMVE